jgi:penicillin amidase
LLIIVIHANQGARSVSGPRPGLRARARRITSLLGVADRAGGAGIALALLARGLLAPRVPPVSLPARLAALAPRLPVQHNVVIHWSEQQIPFIEAESDADLAVALGAVHAHLRLGQMELMRRVATGRVAETIGPLGVELDRALHLFHFARAVPGMIARMSPETRRWAEGFLRGVNHQMAHGQPPPEFRLLGLRPQPWTLAELLTVARLAAADVNWLVWMRLLPVRRRMSTERWAALWPVLLAGGAQAAERGSNAAAIAGHRSRSGAALLAADPHLSVSLPNVWLIAGFRSPGLNAVGLMPAGLPVVAIGRNPWLAWGGTSLHAASSDLFDASGMALTERVETIAVRGGKPRRLVLRESPLGPIVSDGMLLRHRKPLALRWIGHDPSDEMGAMLAVMRARGAEGFRAALADFAVPAQNMVHAGRDGRIGLLLAARLPRRPRAPPPDLVLPPERAADWDETAGTEDLPFRVDPAPGFVASANDAPEPGAIPVGLFFSAGDRVARMRALLGGDRILSAGDLEAMMLDTKVPRLLLLRDALLPLLSRVDAALPGARAWACWDGSFDGASAGAVVQEVLMTDLARRLTSRRRRAQLSTVWASRLLIMNEILTTPEARLRPALHRAIRRADGALAHWRRWDGMHRLRLRHHLAVLPLLGRRLRYGEMAAEGSNDTLLKTGHAPSLRRHGVNHGASARFVADLAEPDANKAVLLGGQDGWLGSAQFLDQAELWRQGKMIALPLRPETARHWPHHTVHTPLAGEK